MSGERQGERRAFPRAAVVGSAIAVAAERYVGTYVLENLSASGALLVGDTKLPVGSRFRLLLQVHEQTRSFAVEASVVRHSTRGAQEVFAVQFVQLPDPVRDALQSAVVGHLNAQRVVLILEAFADDAASLARDLHELGEQTVIVHTPLDAIVWLLAPEASVGAVIAGGARSHADGLSFLAFIGGDYPRTRRILLCRAGDQVPGPAPASQTFALLERPWTRDSLRHALGKAQ